MRLEDEELVSIARILAQTYGSDIAHDTIVRVIECQPHNPLHYARVVAAGLAKNEFTRYTNLVIPMSQLERREVG